MINYKWIHLMKNFEINYIKSVINKNKNDIKFLQFDEKYKNLIVFSHSASVESRLDFILLFPKINIIIFTEIKQVKPSAILENLKEKCPSFKFKSFL